MKESGGICPRDGPLSVLFPEVGKQTFFKVRKSQIRNFYGSFRYRKSATFLSVTVRKSQIHKL